MYQCKFYFVFSNFYNYPSEEHSNTFSVGQLGRHVTICLLYLHLGVSILYIYIYISKFDGICSQTYIDTYGDVPYHYKRILGSVFLTRCYLTIFTLHRKYFPVLRECIFQYNAIATDTCIDSITLDFRVWFQNTLITEYVWYMSWKP